MLLTIDIGNSTITWGLFSDQTLRHHGRLVTDPTGSEEAYAPALLDQIRVNGVSAEHVAGVCVCSVVPPLTSVFGQVCQRLFRLMPLTVSSEIDTGVVCRYADPRQLGHDRLVNAAAAHARYAADVIIVDCGTATTLSAVSKNGELLGGVIVPGLGLSADALAMGTAQLPRVDVVRPKRVVGQDPVSSIQSGLLFGQASAVDGIVSRMQQELAWQPRVIATGGWATLLAPECKTIHEVRPFLTLEGLECVYRLNRGRIPRA